jgi:hypothetical protein
MKSCEIDHKQGFHKHFTSITYECNKISSCLLKTLHASMHEMDDGTAYFVTAIIYLRKMFMKSTTGGNFMALFLPGLRTIPGFLILLSLLFVLALPVSYSVSYKTLSLSPTLG